MDNIVRIVVILSNVAEQRNNFDYLNLVPDIFTKKPKRCFEEQGIYMANDGTTIVLLRISSMDTPFESSGVWLVNYCGYTPSADDVYAFDYATSKRFEDMDADQSQNWITTEEGFAYKITLSEEAFDALINKGEAVH